MARPSLQNERREQILDALEAAVLEDGVSALTVTSVAKRAGISRTAVHHFVGDKGEMIAALFERVIARGDALLDLAIGSATSPSVEICLDLLFGALMKDEGTNRIVTELWNLAARDQQTRERLRRSYELLIAHLRAALEREHPGVGSDTLDGIAFDVTALAYGSAAFGTIGVSIEHSSSRQRAEDIICIRMKKRGDTPRNDLD